MKLTIATLHHSHHHGEDMTAHASEHAAKNSLIEVVTTSWDNVWCEDGSTCDVEDCTGVPRDPDTLERDEAIRLYFAHRSDRESYVIESHDVEIDLAPYFADLISELYAAEAHSRTMPGEPVHRLRAAVQRALAELT